jgi:hypothetical protein
MEEMGEKSFWPFRFFLICIFTGSIFLTSGKFVNEINSPKSYFAAACLSIALSGSFSGELFIQGVSIGNLF